MMPWPHMGIVNCLRTDERQITSILRRLQKTNRGYDSRLPPTAGKLANVSTVCMTVRSSRLWKLAEDNGRLKSESVIKTRHRSPHAMDCTHHSAYFLGWKSHCNDSPCDERYLCISQLHICFRILRRYFCPLADSKASYGLSPPRLPKYTKGMSDPNAKTA